MSSNPEHRQQRSQAPGYAVLIAAYNALLALALLAAKRFGRLGSRPQASDLVLIALATQRLSRLLAKDRVTSAIRAPFTAYQGEGGPGELEERPRGRGLRRALGELLVCPFCLAQWVATALAVGLLFAPRVTRFVAAVFSVVGIADTLQLLYRGAEKATVES